MQPVQPTNVKQYVAYYRVSTDKQGQSGLGLEAQQAAVERYLAPHGVKPIAEYTEVESGRKINRKQLQAALDHAERIGATLLIAKLDRLARSVSFITTLLDGKVPFVTVDMPDANKMMLQISAVFAEHEAKMTSDRTKAAIAAKRARGQEWGTNAAKVESANAFADSIQRHIQTLIQAGIDTPAAIARALNEASIRTPRGAEWGPGQVVRLLRRIQEKDLQQ